MCCKPCKKKGKRKSSARTDGSGRNSVSLSPEDGNVHQANVKMPNYLVDPCSPFDFAKLWGSHPDLIKNAITKANGIPICVEHREVTNVQRRQGYWEKANGKDGDESACSSSDEEGAAELNWSCKAGAASRLKKDATRRLRCGDESVLECNNPDEGDFIRACAGVSSSRAQNSTRDKNVLRYGACTNESAESSTQSSVAAARPPVNGTWRRNVRIIEGEVEADDSVCAPLAIESVSVPAYVRTNVELMDDEDRRVAEEIQEMLKQDASNGDALKEVAPCNPEPTPLPYHRDSSATPFSDFEAVDEDDLKLYSPASSTASIAGTFSPQMDDEVARDIEYILNDDLPADETGELSPEPVTSREEHHETNNIIPKETTESVVSATSPSLENNPEKHLDRKLDDESVVVGESDGANSVVEVKMAETTALEAPLKNYPEASTIEDLNMGEDVHATEREFLVREVICTDESCETVSNSVTAAHCGLYSDVSPQLEDEDEDEDGVECIPLPEVIPLRNSAVSQLGKDYVLSDQKKDKETSKNTINIRQFHVQNDSSSLNKDAFSHSEWKCFASSSLQKLEDSGVPSTKAHIRNCSVTAAETLSLPENRFSSTTQKLPEDVIAMNVETVLNDEMSSAKLNWYGAAPRPKTRNPRRDFSRNADQSSNTIPRLRQKYFEMGKQEGRKENNTEESTPRQPAPQSSGPGARSKTNFTRKPMSREDIEMAKAFSETSDEPDSVLGISLRSPCSGGKQLPRQYCMERECERPRSKKSAANVLCARELKKSTAHPCVDVNGRSSESPYARVSSSSIETTNCDSSCSVIIADALRPMAASSSKVVSSACSSNAASASGLQDAKTPRPSTNPKGKSRRPVIFVKPAPDTRLLGVEARRKAAVLADGGQSGACAQSCSGNVYDPGELKLMTEIEKSHDIEKQRMTVLNKKATEPVNDGLGSCNQSVRLNPVCGTEGQNTMPFIEKRFDKQKAGKVRGESRRIIASAVDASSPSMLSYRGGTRSVADKYHNAYARRRTPRLVYTADMLNLKARLEEQPD